MYTFEIKFVLFCSVIRSYHREVWDIKHSTKVMGIKEMLELDLNREGERYVMNGIALMHKRVHHFISLLKKHVTYVLSSGGSTAGH